MGYVVMTMCKAWVIRGEAPRGEGRGVGGREGDREGRRQEGILSHVRHRHNQHAHAALALCMHTHKNSVQL